MGFKRPFDDVEFQDLPFKHPRQHEFGDKLAPFSDSVSCYGAPRKTYVSGENGNGDCKSQWFEVLEKYAVTEDSTSVIKDRVTRSPFSLVPRICLEEDVGSGPDAYSPPSEDYEFDVPRRTFVPFKDVYSSLSDRSPRKQVLVGPNHQASIPTWSGRMKWVDQTDESNLNHFSLHSLGSDKVVNKDSEEKLLGTCVIPMPDSKAPEFDEVGLGRTDCSCLDAGTVRCVQQHVMEAREELRRTLGNEKFVKLGFCDMGEVVAQGWSEEEKQTFLEVVYSNPASIGRNFWKHLSAVVPSRSKRELVSYYFNVFMLRRRAAQNRSNILEVDSDDDEWHGNNDGRVAEDDEDSVVDSLVYQNDNVGHEEDSSEEDDSDDDDDNDNDDSDGDVGHVKKNFSEEDGGIDHIAESYMLKSVDDSQYDTENQHGEKFSGCSGEEFDFQDDSCVSFEFQSHMHDSCGQNDAGAALQVTGFTSGDRSKCLQSQSDASSGDVVVGHAYLLEPCDAKVWDARFPMDPMKGVDVLPTWSMIEEIFDQGMGDYNKRDEHEAPASG